jgi:hypothetical protein
LNPRPAGYESANDSTEPAAAVTVYVINDSLVATLVATETPDKPCETAFSHDELRRLIAVLPADLAAVARCWELLSGEARKSVVSLVQALARK